MCVCMKEEENRAISLENVTIHTSIAMGYRLKYMHSCLPKFLIYSYAQQKNSCGTLD